MGHKSGPQARNFVRLGVDVMCYLSFVLNWIIGSKANVAANVAAPVLHTSGLFKQQLRKLRKIDLCHQTTLCCRLPLYFVLLTENLGIHGRTLIEN